MHRAAVTDIAAPIVAPIAANADPLPPHAMIRAATAGAHTEVDAAFGGFNLGDRNDYAAFLTAHARVLPAMEEVLSGNFGLPSFAPRKPALAADLAALDVPFPPALAVSVPGSAAAAWGMFYVIEGSRLGGMVLARGVPDTMPKAYLGSAHPRGGWRTLLAALDAACREGCGSWLADAVEAARRTFDLYAGAAAEQAAKLSAVKTS